MKPINPLDVLMPEAITATPRPWHMSARNGWMSGEGFHSGYIKVHTPFREDAWLDKHGQVEPQAIANAELICRAVNCHDQLVEALKKCEDVIGMARLQGKLSNSGLSPVNDALVAARTALDATREVV